MKSIAVLGGAVLALVARHAEAFFVPVGNLVGGASPASPLTAHSVSSSSSIGARGAARVSGGCSCPSCNAGTCGKSCSCPSCASGLSSRSHAAGCRCGSCSVRMQAHAVGCGCGECSPAPAAFHGASCECPDCDASAAKTHGCSCACGACASRPGRRGASSATAMRMGAGQVSEAGEGLRARLAEEPESVMFEDSMATIETGFDYTPKRFVNGATSSGAGENEGSCKVFAFGKIAGLSSAETLACFGEHYRGVLADPEGDSHGNIRAFMESGWDGVEFPDGVSLSPK